MIEGNELCHKLYQETLHEYSVKPLEAWVTLSSHLCSRQNLILASYCLPLHLVSWHQQQHPSSWHQLQASSWPR